MKKPKYLFISNAAAPHQVNFIGALQRYFEVEFVFYVRREAYRPVWWEIPLNDKCKILSDGKKFKKYRYLPNLGYYSFSLLKELIHFKPDVVVLGGCMIWHVLIMRVAKFIGAKVAIISEPALYDASDNQHLPVLLNRDNAKLTLQITKLLFNDVDLLIGMGPLAQKQFIEEFRFNSKKVISLPYPQDIEAYYKHPLRNKHYNDEITILFANRLISRYNPLLALNVYKRLKIKYSNIKLMMNAEGSLRSDCDEFILNNELKDVCFLEKITSWNDMHLIYKNADILILPCSYSNGNGSIIEARASGMGIVISHQINNVQKHSIDKENCFICELNEEAFVDGVSKYLDNPQLIDEHGKISRKLVEYKLNDNIAKQYYEALLKHEFF